MGTGILRDGVLQNKIGLNIKELEPSSEVLEIQKGYSRDDHYKKNQKNVEEQADH
jgi:hypothetical protein